MQAVPALAAEPAWSWQNPKPVGATLWSVSFVDASTVIAVGDGGTILRSQDMGATWQSVDTQTTFGLNDISFGTATNGMIVGSRGYALRTMDGGLSWSPVTGPAPYELYDVRFIDASVGVVNSYSLYRTTNGGATWQSHEPPPDVTIGDVWVVDADNFIMVGGQIDTEAGPYDPIVYRTSDGGATWTTLYHQDTGAVSTHLTNVAFAAANGTAVGGPGLIVHSTDGGNSWTVRPINTQQTFSAVAMLDVDHEIAVGAGGRIVATMDGTNWSIRDSHTSLSLYGLAASGNVAVAVGQNGVITRSTDAGTTWQPVSSSVTYDPIHGVSFVDALNGVVVGDKGAIFRTHNGGQSWTPQPSVATSTLRDVVLTDANHGVAVGDNGFILQTVDGGATWIRRISNTANELDCISFDGPGTGYVGGIGLVLKTTDGGTTWVRQTNAPNFWYNDVSAEAGAATFALDYWIVARTVDGGVSWTQQTLPWRERFRGVCFVDKDTGIIVGSYGGIARTTDGGMTWTKVSTNTTRNLNAVSFGDAMSGVAVGEYGDVRFTTDGGLTWKWQRSGTFASYYGDLYGVCMTGPQTGNIVGNTGAILRMQPEGPVPVLISSFNGRLISRGVELSWSLYSDEAVQGLYVYRSRIGQVQEVALNAEPMAQGMRRYVDANTVPGEAYRYSLVALTETGSFRSPAVDITVPALEAKLFQNTPNPFNPTTTIAYTVPVASRVRLAVYSLDGALVRNLVDRLDPAGMHEVEWDGRNNSGAPVASGLYFCRLNTGKTTISKKMILLK